MPILIGIQLAESSDLEKQTKNNPREEFHERGRTVPPGVQEAQEELEINDQLKHEKV